MENAICLTPYKEIKGGEESIYDYVQEGYSVPEQVIAYLRTTQPYMMSPGIYEHPFIPGKRLLGPYWYTDGKYYWDRDTWKYVVKYHVRLPADFINHVLSSEGREYLDGFFMHPSSWSDTISGWKEQKGSLCLLPDDAGDCRLEDF